MHRPDALPTTTADPTGLRWSSSSRSHAGRVRPVNEDACLDQPTHGVWAVADGMGGHALGEFASRLAVRCLTDLPEAASLADRLQAAEQRLQDANRRLRAEAARRDLPVIGTTIATLLAVGPHCACVWAGDSRIYLLRDGRLRQLTRDHNHLEALRALHAEATLALHAPDSEPTLERPPSNLITRALGAEDTLDLDSLTVDVQDGDVFLLCSDGLSNEVADLDIAQALLPGHCRLAAEALVHLALDQGGHDNITAVVVRAEDLDGVERTAVNLPSLP
ncbi:MAG: protein phosphatase 2C domain-containing protein [Rhizobacter sp.]|nr:protein phosphatase 2C domain-containing protein [Rhizobacter sp.]